MEQKRLLRFLPFDVALPFLCDYFLAYDCQGVCSLSIHIYIQSYIYICICIRAKTNFVICDLSITYLKYFPPLLWHVRNSSESESRHRNTGLRIKCIITCIFCVVYLALQLTVMRVSLLNIRNSQKTYNMPIQFSITMKYGSYRYPVFLCCGIQYLQLYSCELYNFKIKQE